MSKTLTFGSTVVDVPTSAQSPNWAEGVTDAFTAISETLATVAGPFDVAAQSQIIDSSNPGVANTDVTALTFPVTNVRAFNVSYAVYRTTNSTTAYETGSIIAIYSPSNSPGSLWEVSQDIVGNGQIAFNVTDLGQVQYTCTAIAGTGHTGKIIFSGKAILQS
jgi:hypothetical protein